MENYYTPINTVDYKNLAKKETFTDSDVKQLAKYIPTSLEKEFDTPLKPSEAREVCSLVCKNIYKIVQVYHGLVQNNRDHDYLITKEFLKMCKDQVGEDEAKLIPLKAAFIFANGTGSTYRFEGKIPKKGFFSNRQVIADKWIDNFIKHLGWNIISMVLSKTGNNKDAAFIASTEFIACFLVNTYPNEFDKNANIKDIIVDLSRK